MSNKTFIIVLLISSLISISANHYIYGNSNATLSQYEMVKLSGKEYSKKRRVKKLSKHMYKRVLYWQEIHKKWQRQEKNDLIIIIREM